MNRYFSWCLEPLSLSVFVEGFLYLWCFNTQPGSLQLHVILQFLLAQRLKFSQKGEGRAFSGLAWAKALPYTWPPRFQELFLSFSNPFMNISFFSFLKLFGSQLCILLYSTSGSHSVQQLSLVFNKCLGKEAFYTACAESGQITSALQMWSFWQLTDRSSNENSLAIGLWGGSNLVLPLLGGGGGCCCFVLTDCGLSVFKDTADLRKGTWEYCKLNCHKSWSPYWESAIFTE